MEKRGTVVPLWNFQTKTMKLPVCIDVCATFSGVRLRERLAGSPRGGLWLRQNLPVGYPPAFYTFGGFRYHGTTPRHVCGLLLRVA